MKSFHLEPGDKTNWFVKHKITTAILVLIVIGAIGSAASPKTPTQPSQPAAADKSVTTAATKPTVPTPAPTPQVLLDLQGSGTKSTQKFTAASDWDLNWSYDCSNFGTQGNFMVQITNGDGSYSYDNQAVNQLGAKGTDVEHYHKGGTFYLQISSECSWQVTAKG